jgi:hypothetical protein
METKFAPKDFAKDAATKLQHQILLVGCAMNASTSFTRATIASRSVQTSMCHSNPFHSLLRLPSLCNMTLIPY